VHVHQGGGAFQKQNESQQTLPVEKNSIIKEMKYLKTIQTLRTCYLSINNCQLLMLLRFILFFFERIKKKRRNVEEKEREREREEEEKVS
jgi:hypothetical protein